MKLSENILKNMHVLLCFKHFTHIPPQQGGRLSSTCSQEGQKGHFCQEQCQQPSSCRDKAGQKLRKEQKQGEKTLKIPGQSGEPEHQFHLALGRASCFSVFSLFSWSPSSEFVSQI